ncbi:YfgM family protein [Thaumasiovibrio subtropicus]|uniref:YfgM family protein n=1 Tax=Thaumasiovibrio subtropicus TaxID=1891207 RepID=UPI000B35A708|nr:YfgM family protein [Thaumasiovibrio subtropicus]
MEAYETEEQQVEAIKKWWKENGKSIILGAVIGLGGLFGWRAYQANVLSSQEAASDAYSKAQEQLIAGDLDAVKQFVTENSSSEYATLAAMQLAKAQVENDNLSAAVEQLKWVVANSKDDALKALANVRLARVEIALENFDAAESALAAVTAESWKANVASLRGDIAVQRGDHDAARAAYTEALAAGNDPVVRMKLDDLAQ